MTTEYLIVTAAKPGTWLREHLDPRSWVRMLGEGLISDYAEKMELLREADDRIQNWTEDLSQLAKEADQALKARRLVDVAIILNEINERFKKVQEFESFVKEVSESAITQFQQESERSVPSTGVFAQMEPCLIIEAGLFNDLRRKFLSEKLQNKEQKEKFLALKLLVQYTKQVVEKVKKILKEMEKNRAFGNIGKYLDGLKQINLKQNEFQKKFQDVYLKYLKPLVAETLNNKNLDSEKTELQKDLEKSLKKEHKEKHKVEEKQHKVEEKIKNVDPESNIQKIRIAPPTVKELGTQLVPNEPVEEIPDLPLAEPLETMPKTSEVNQIWLQKINADFIVELMKASSYDDPGLLVQMLLKHAEKLENLDSNCSLKLLAIAEGSLHE